MSDAPPPPPGSRVEVVERGDRLVLRAPAGSPRAGSILAFALLWNLISWAVAGVFWGLAFANGVDWNLKPAGGQNGPVPWFVLPLVGLFPAIGVGLLIWWLRMRFTRTLLFADAAEESGAGTVAVRTEWFGRERTRTVRLQPGDRATLEVAYEENHVPRYRVRVGPKGEKNRTLAFGTAWSDEEVRWVAAEINRVLEAETPDDLGAHDADAPPRTSTVESREEVDCPHIRETLDARGRPVVEVRLWPAWPPGKRAFVAFGAVFSLVWWSIVGFTVAGELEDARRNGNWADPFGLLFCVPFVLAGLAMVSGLIAVCRATVRTTVGEEWLSVRWGMGLIGYTHTVPRERIAEVVLWENFGTTRDARGTHRIPAAAVRVGPAGPKATHIPLSVGGDPDVATAVAGLVRHHLEASGWRASGDDGEG